MKTTKKGLKTKTELWEVLSIVFIWLLTISMVYIIFWKAKSN
ncbi:hypothetical protein SAMN04487995_4690 [Dyadobacter koreensis]|uniref:Uncharacterized protein n=1 Tax=Dyadobacter koreensis TaxID=408657 RepID=A0A1H6Z0M1_9BACT|nr:hypothetical protein [Dyadobacter koreensis]SEJ43152.1 hypothetical protein SAMN04487995_4690 [Dyadobacter koreensis]